MVKRAPQILSTHQPNPEVIGLATLPLPLREGSPGCFSVAPDSELCQAGPTEAWASRISVSILGVVRVCYSEVGASLWKLWEAPAGSLQK